MDGLRLFFHSPFTPESVADEEGPALLLQFILQEVVKEEFLSEANPPLLAPFDWSWRQGSMYKVREHGMLLRHAFPEMGEEVEVFLKGLGRRCEELVELLEPFIWVCRKSDGLLCFMLRYEERLGRVIDKICPEGVEAVKMKVSKRYRKRGFNIRWSGSFEIV
jgi:hypothetical protein